MFTVVSHVEVFATGCTVSREKDAFTAREFLSVTERTQRSESLSVSKVPSCAEVLASGCAVKAVNGEFTSTAFTPVTSNTLFGISKACG